MIEGTFPLSGNGLSISTPEISRLVGVDLKTVHTDLLLALDMVDPLKRPDDFDGISVLRAGDRILAMNIDISYAAFAFLEYPPEAREALNGQFERLWQNMNTKQH